MRLAAGTEMSIQKSRIVVFGLAKLGRADGSMIDGPGSLSMPAHRLSGVYAGLATHGLKGNELSDPIPVLVHCNDDDQVMNVRSNTIGGSWLASEKYNLIAIQSIQEDCHKAA
jgi:hypothetical protein